MTEKTLPAELALEGFTAQICDAPNVPGPVRDLFAVAFDIKRETREAIVARDKHEEDARIAVQTEAAAMAGEIVRGNFDTDALLDEKVAEHKAEAERLQRRINGLEAARPRVINEIRTTVAKHIDSWRLDAERAGDAAIVDLAAALSMTRDAYVALNHSLGVLSALDDFEGRQEGVWAREWREGHLRLMPRPNGWTFAIEPAIEALEEAVDLAAKELRYRSLDDAERDKADKVESAAKKAAEPAETPAPSDDTPAFEMGADDE